MKRIYKNDNKKVAGVCAGIGNYFNIDPTLIRVLFVITAFFTFFSILAYIILAICIPYDNNALEPVITKKLYKYQYDKKISGVCSGIGIYCGIDPTIIRILFVIALFFNLFLFIAYIICANIIPVDNNIIE